MKSTSKLESVGPVTTAEMPKRRQRSKAERRRVVEETLVPGASVAIIARTHGVNANQVFHWRKLYREGRLDVKPSETQFLPARLIDSGLADRSGVEPKTGMQHCGGMIEIEIGCVRVRITGSADLGCVRAALEQLR